MSLESDLPALYAAADRASRDGQRRFLVATRVTLGLSVLAAAAGVATLDWHGADWAGVVAAAAFLGAIIAGSYILVDHPEQAWYDGRAAAESSKSLAWQYASGAGPFSVDECPDPDALLVERLREVLTKLRGFALLGSVDDGEQISPAMRTLRSSSLEERRAAYLADRLDDQRKWYTHKAGWNAQRNFRWRVAALSSQVAGGLFAVLKATGLLEIDLLGVLAAVAVAAAAWVQARDHANLAQAYSVTAQELSLVRARADEIGGETEWAQFVDDAEQAISREHTLWLARRGTIANPG
jgi:hypothetical protein